MKLVFLLALPASLLAYPSCQPPIESFWPPGPNAALTWQTCDQPGETNVLYGVSNAKYEYFEAAAMCKSFGAKLVSAIDDKKDQCLFHVLKQSSVKGEEVMYSARYFKDFNQNDKFNGWAWCQDYDCTPLGDWPNDYSNWEPDFYTEGVCMGAFLQDTGSGSETFADNYGWVKRDCSEPAKVVCRIDCDAGNNEPAEPAGPAQKFFYTVASGDKSNFATIYEYDVDDAANPVKIAAHNLPYQSSCPNLAYNYQLDVLEIVGDAFYKLKEFHTIPN